jgi:hypothetical protein
MAPGANNNTEDSLCSQLRPQVSLSTDLGETRLLAVLGFTLEAKFYPLAARCKEELDQCHAIKSYS